MNLQLKNIESKDKTNYDNFYSTPNAEIIINKSDIDDVFQSICTKIITNIQKSLEKCFSQINDSVIDHKLPKEVGHPIKSLINFQDTDDNECFKWYLVRYLNPADHIPKIITKS